MENFAKEPVRKNQGRLTNHRHDANFGGGIAATHDQGLTPNDGSLKKFTFLLTVSQQFKCILRLCLKKGLATIYRKSLFVRRSSAYQQEKSELQLLILRSQCS
jgi:hypothetical protein